VVYEDLQVQNLVKNHHLAKSLVLAVRSTFQDAAWSIFTGWLDDYGKV
jgi:putative transposase